MDLLHYQQLIGLQEEVKRLRLENATLKANLDRSKNEKAGIEEGLNENAKAKRRPRGKKKNPKPFASLGETMREVRKRRLQESIMSSCQEIIPDKIRRISVDVTLEDGTNLKLTPVDEKVSESMASSDFGRCPQNSLQQVINVKDKYMISDEAMHELHMLKIVIPSKNQILDEKKRVSTLIPIRQFPGGNEDCSLRSLSDDVLDYVLKLPQNESLISSLHSGMPSIMCRFSCDGAKITKRKDSVRGVFKILHPREKLPVELSALSMSPEDELTLFFFIGGENRVNMKKYAESTLQDMRISSLHDISISEKQFNINWILTCDWKALTILKGINSANSQHFCIWCHCSKSQICDFSIQTWDIQRSEAARQKYMGTKEHHGYTEEDLCPFIPFTQIVPDDLHLRIRISLKLFNQVVIWSIDQHREKELQLEMDRIGVPFSFWEVQGDNNCGSVKKWSQPSGDELEAIVRKTQLCNILDSNQDRRYVSVDALTVDVLKDELKQRNLSTKGKKLELIVRLKEHLEPNQKFLNRSKSRLRVSYELSEDESEDLNSLDIDALQDIWCRFGDLMEALRALPSSPLYLTWENFKKKARKWAEDFRKYTFDEDVTPYIHCMVYHVPQFIQKYNYLHDIGVSQVERKNYDHRLAYFGSTNRSGGKSKKKVSLQILERENRLLWSKSQGLERIKRQYNRRPLSDI